MRKETSNQFTDGLISDLNPINTPNTVLTDSLNGTIITYNGNEMILQNDMGNYKLRDCRLKPNYIPVGIKEHGDILYIVSYNPLNKHVEVGSYPSPLVISRADEDNSDLDLKSIIQTQILDEGETEGNYTKLMENSDRSIIFNGDKFFLNPGDEYCMQVSGKTPHKFETYDYYILDNESGSHNVTNEIVLDNDLTRIDYQHVPWTIPGWIYSVIRLAEIASMSLNVREFYVPKTGDELNAQFNFNIKLNINDEYLTGKQGNEKSVVEQWCADINNPRASETDISFRIQVEKLNDDGEWKSLIDDDLEFNLKNGDTVDESGLTYTPKEYGWTEWYDSAVIIFKNISGNIPNLKEDDQIRVKVVPILSQSNYKIVYDNLEQSLIFDLKSIDDKPWDLGSSFYKFYLNNAKDAQIINFNVDGPLVASSWPKLTYKIYNDKSKETGGTIDDWAVGTNNITIKFNTDFIKENIYLIEFIFTFEKESKSFKRVLITSEVFENFIESDYVMYDRIPSGKWLPLYEKYWKIKYNPKITIDNGELTKDEVSLPNTKYSSFSVETKTNITNTYKYKYNVDLEGKIEETHLSGPIWEQINACDEKFKYFNGIEDIEQNSLKNISIFYKKDYTYRYIQNGNFPFAELDVEEPSKKKHPTYLKYCKDMYICQEVISSDQNVKVGLFLIDSTKNKILKTYLNMDSTPIGKFDSISHLYTCWDQWEDFPIVLLETKYKYEELDDSLKAGYQNFFVSEEDQSFKFYGNRRERVYKWLLLKTIHSNNIAVVMIPFYRTELGNYKDNFQDLISRITLVKSCKNSSDKYKYWTLEGPTSSNLEQTPFIINMSKKYEFSWNYDESLKYTACLQNYTLQCESKIFEKELNINPDFSDVDVNFNKKMRSYNTQAEKDYDEWTKSIYYTEYESRKKFGGMYIKDVSYEGDSLLQKINECWEKNGYFGIIDSKHQWHLEVIGQKGKKSNIYPGYSFPYDPEIYTNWFTDET